MSKRKPTVTKYTDYSHITDLVIAYKKSNDKEDLNKILIALNAMIDSYYKILNSIYIPEEIMLSLYMKKFLITFATEKEKENVNEKLYTELIRRVKHIMSNVDNEDIYQHIILTLIIIIKGAKIIDGCDILYYIQFLMKYRIYTYVLKHSKELAIQHISLDDENFIINESELQDNNISLVDMFYNDIPDDILIREDDIYSQLTQYEKYILYLKEKMNYTNKQVLSLIIFDNDLNLSNITSKIKEKLTILNNEGVINE